jgi:indolepyruvate ferredoxin oxidoreductase
MKVSLDDKYSLIKGRAFMTGIEALVRLPILQHQRDLEKGLNTACFISGYRGSPIGGLDQALWKAKSFVDQHNIHFLPGVNEDLAMTSVWGSQQVGLFPGAKYDGVFGMWYGKGPGLDRSMDVLKHANAFGTSQYGGVLAVVGDDHACKSSTLPHQSDHMFIGATSPVLNPAGVQEILDLGLFGWELSRYSGCWVGMKAITENMDAIISAEIDSHRVEVKIPDDYQLPEDGVHIRWPDTPMAQEERLQRHKIYAARAFARANNLNRIEFDSDKARLGIVTTGKSYLDTLQALEDLGIDDRTAGLIGLRLYKIGMSWPLEPVMTHQFAEGLEEILVIEEKRSVIEDQLTGQLYNWPVERRPRVVGEYDENRELLVSNLGELTPARIARVIASRISRFYNSDTIKQRLAFLETKEASLAKPRFRSERKPWFCSGCPHNTSTRVPKGSKAFGGIGCHYMATWMDRDTDTFTQMGGEGATWLGQAPFTETRHVFQNLGDGTYFHSGLLAIRAAVAARVNITYKILFNDAVAMTGGQTFDGPLTVEIIVEQIVAEGVGRIVIVSDQPEEYQHCLNLQKQVSVADRSRLEQIQLELRDTAGCTAIIYAQTCAAEKRRRRKKKIMVDPPKRVFINEMVCEGCGDCGQQSNCLSLIPKETEFGRKRSIDQSACNKDFSCINGFCPSFVTVHGGQLRKPSMKQIEPCKDQIPEPKKPSLEVPYNILITGIGGTGVLTVGSVLGMAAHIEQKGASVLNQTGLAQKFGAVSGHIRIAEQQRQIHSVRIPAGEAHLLIGADLIVSESDDSLAKLDKSFSQAIVNTHLSPTAEFTRNPDALFPIEVMKTAIESELEPGKTHFLDATKLATHLLGDAIYSNLLLLGVAYQCGFIPLSSESIIEAIKLNGVSIDLNINAFNWGRRVVVEPESINQYFNKSDPDHSESSSQDLDTVINIRQKFLIDYQDEAYSSQYVETINQIRKFEQQLINLTESNLLKLTTVIAKNYFKLLSYKDEYEVARLLSHPDFEQAIKQQFEGDFKLAYHLAPPFLSKADPLTGKIRKREFGSWMKPVFCLLTKCRKVRGSRWDLFGFNEERRHERKLIRDYENDIEFILRHTRSDNYAISIELARWPELVRGFGPVKQANTLDAETNRQHLHQLMIDEQKIQPVIYNSEQF